MWNELIKHVSDLKALFIKTYGEENLWDYGEYNNCIEYWSATFEFYNEMFAPLIIHEFEDLVLFRYNLMDTDAEFWQKYNQMYRECRSVVIDKKKCCLVLTPFRKFFNLNETEETQLRFIQDRIANARSIEFSEKMDGSMQSARFYDGRIILAGTQSMNKDESFRVAIGYSLLGENYKKMLKENPDYTFIFELICKEDRHVVKYDDSQRGLYLIGIRDVLTGKESSYAEVLAMAQNYNVLHTTVVDKTLDQALNELDSKRSDEAEGFVINIDGYKIKLKFNDYLNVHRMLGKITSTNVIIRAVEDGSWDDLLSKIPEAYQTDAIIVADNVKKFVREMSKAIDAMYKKVCIEITEQYGEINQKLLAMHVLNKSSVYYTYSAYLINKFLNKENNFIKNRAGRYLRYHEILTRTNKIKFVMEEM